MAVWNIQNAISFLSRNAKSKSIGHCAKYVRMAIEAGGLSTGGRPGSAYQYKGYLPKIGFNAIGNILGKEKQKEWSRNNAKPGDIAVMNHGEHGHICMWNGSKWISDFPQNNMWVYDGDGTCTIFRFNGTIDGSLAPYNGEVGGGLEGGALSNYELATPRDEQNDNTIIKDIFSLRKHIIAMILEGEGVICTSSKHFKDKSIIEDTLFKKYNGTYDEPRINGLYRLYDANVSSDINYTNNDLSLSEFVATAVINPEGFIDVGENCNPLP